MKKIILLLAFIVLFKVGSAQTEDYASKLVNVLPLSPNTASLGKFGNVPVGNYTGVPKVNVPIYTIEAGDIKIPLTLDHHNGGVKVEDIASWVGMGWSFSFGGMIARQIRGVADDNGGGYLSTNSLMNQFESWSTAQKEAYIGSVKNELHDSQNDIFSYSFGNVTGRFFFKPDGEIVTKPRTSIHFEFGNFFGQSGFKVVNTDGVIYYFLNKEETVSYTNTIPATVDPLGPTSAVSAWYISKIVSPEGQEVVFEYDTETETYGSPLAQTIYMSDPPGGTGCGKTPLFARSTTSVLAQKLKRIQFPNGEVIITTGSTERADLQGGHALTTIQIKNNLGREIKRFDFTYITTSSSPGQYINKRLFLDKIQVSANSTPLGTYRFEYETPHILPDRESKDQDFWGYYNGANNNTTLIPYFFYTKSNGVFPYLGGNRTPEPAYTKAGSLKRMYYPTGGYTEFTMENNTVSNLLSVIEKGYDLKGGTGLFQIFGDGAGIQTIYNGSFSVAEGYGGSGGVYAKIQVGLPNSSAMPPPPATGDDPLIQLTKPNGSIINLRNNITTFLPIGNYSVHIDFTSNPDPALIHDFYVIVSYDYGVRDNPGKLKNLVVGGLRVKSIKDVDPISGNVVERTYQYLKEDGVTSTGLLGSFPSYTASIETCRKEVVNEEELIYVCNYLTVGAVSQSPLLLTQGSNVGYGMVDEFIDNGNNGKNRYFYTTFADFNDLGDYKQYPYPPSDSRDEFRGLLLRQQTFKRAANNYGLVYEKSFNYNFSIGNGYSNFDPLLVSVPGYHFRQFYFNSGCWATDGVPYHRISQFNTKSGTIFLLNDTARTYDQYDPNKYLQVINTYEYSLKNLQANKISIYISNRDLSVTSYKFPLDYDFTSPVTDEKLRGVSSLISKYKINQPVETSSFISKNGGPLQLVNSRFVSVDPDVALPKSIFSIDIKGPINDFLPSSVQSNALAIDGRYSSKIIFDKYLPNGRLLQQKKTNDVLKSYIWDYNSTYVIAEVTNAEEGQIAYTSFETDYLGHWSLNPGSTFLTNTGNITGNRSLNGGVSIAVPQGNYILSLWSATAPVVNGQAIAIAPRKSIGPGKSYYQIELSGVSSVSVSGNNIDEIRLYPKGAEMTTMTYEPLIGVTSQADTRGYITYYDYDGGGRLSVIRDEKGQVLKSINYHYINQ